MNYCANNKRELNRRKVIAAAIELFALKGCFGTKIEDISDKSGRGIGWIYSNFRQGKFEIFLLIIIEYWQEVIESIQRELALSFDPALSLEIIANQFFISLANDRMSRLRATILAESLPSDITGHGKAIEDMFNLIVELNARFNNIFTKTIEAGQKNGTVVCELNANVIRDTIVGGIRGLVKVLSLQECGYRNAEYDIDDARKACSQLLVRFVKIKNKP